VTVPLSTTGRGLDCFSPAMIRDLTLLKSLYCNAIRPRVAVGISNWDGGHRDAHTQTKKRGFKTKRDAAEFAATVEVDFHIRLQRDSPVQ